MFKWNVIANALPFYWAVRFTSIQYSSLRVAFSLPTASSLEKECRMDTSHIASCVHSSSFKCRSAQQASFYHASFFCTPSLYYTLCTFYEISATDTAHEDHMQHKAKAHGLCAPTVCMVWLFSSGLTAHVCMKSTFHSPFFVFFISGWQTTDIFTYLHHLVVMSVPLRKLKWKGRN